MNKKRGRPPKYDEAEVLEKALGIFWVKGLSSTSLDDLSAAMGMNRPSIYNAFGDKESIYRLAFSRFSKKVEMGAYEALFSLESLPLSLEKMFVRALDVYYQEEVALGCFCMSTAPVESIQYPNIKEDLHSLIEKIDQAVEKRLLLEQESGWKPDADTKVMAKLIHAVLQGIAIRVRSGEPREPLDKLFKSTIEMVCY